MADLKSSFGFQEQQLNSLKVSLSKVMKANDAMKVELQALRKKVNDQKSEMDELYESHDDLEQYTRKNSLEIHGVPENLYTSTEDVVIKLGEVLNVPIQSEDIDISHKLYSGKNKPKNIIVKFISHKKKTALYKKRVELKNVKITQLFPHSTTAAALASERLYINESLTSFRKDLMKEANQMKKMDFWSVYGPWTARFTLRPRLMAHPNESVPRKTSTTYDCKLARLRFSTSLFLSPTDKLLLSF